MRTWRPQFVSMVWMPDRPDNPRPTTLQPHNPTTLQPYRVSQVADRPNPADVYRARLADREIAVAGLARQHDRLANARLGVAVLAAVIAWGAFGAGLWSGWWLVLPAVAFASLALVHDRVLSALDRARRAVGVYERGLARVEDRWSGSGPTGLAYAPADHPYAADLDLFGDGSLFQLLSAARLHAGEETLASWLLAPGTPESIAARQAAIDELRGKVDLRERLALTGESVSAWLDTEGLARWGGQPPILSGRWPRVVAVALAAGNVAAVAAGFWADASPAWLALAVGLSVAFAMWWRSARPPGDRVGERTGTAPAAARRSAGARRGRAGVSRAAGRAFTRGWRRPATRRRIGSTS